MKKKFCMIAALVLLVPVLFGCQGAAMSTTPASGGDLITEDRAKELALSHAGLNQEQVTGLYVEHDLDERVPHYDVDFHHDGYEYDYEIHGQTGEVLKSEKERD